MDKLSNFDEFVLYRALAFKYSGSSAAYVFDPPDVLQYRNVCAKLHSDLVDDLDDVIGILDISKRQFIETALVDALARAHKILDDIDFLEFHRVNKVSKEETL